MKELDYDGKTHLKGFSMLCKYFKLRFSFVLLAAYAELKNEREEDNRMSQELISERGNIAEDFMPVVINRILQNPLWAPVRGFTSGQ